MSSTAELEGSTQGHGRPGEFRRLEAAPAAPLLDPIIPKPQIMIRLFEPHNSMARELAGRRGQPVGRVLADLLARVLPQALDEEVARSEAAVGSTPPEEVGAGGA